MATVVTNTTAKAIGSYVGETNKQIREGFGVYTYPNKYFRYEGEWKDGKKHGHGRLLMGDGSFYEGSFDLGEIEGHGYRRWSLTNNSYTGQFERGELSGSGVMQYGNGDKYEGSWQNNQREGTGSFTQANGDSYNGSFYQHKRHGQGYQIYSNGDQYEGEWVKGKRQGHGTMKYYDATIYDGQWRDDMFNGEGSIIHVSGTTYEGLWISGRPAVEAFTLSIKGPALIEVEQGETFSIEIECQSVDGEVTQDNGRLLQVTAGMKVLAKNLQIENKLGSEQAVRITTPFDFVVEPYPVIELSPNCDVPASWWTGLGPNEGSQSSSIMEPAKSTEGEPVKDLALSQVLSDVSKDSSSPAQAPPYQDGTPEAVLTPSISPMRTISGTAQLDNIYLLPLPPGMKSYSSMILDDLAADGRTSEMNQKFKRRERRGSMAASSADESKEAKRRKEKKEDKTIEDKNKCCRPGDYVVIVQDVTNPPFLGAVLQPAFLRVKMNTKQKRAKSKEKR